nr:exonuclease [uncultured phage]CAI9752258.1 exonuclease [uncultured phage]
MSKNTLLIDGNAVAYTINIAQCKDEKQFAKFFFSRLREYAKQFTCMPKALLFFDDKAGGNWREELYPDYQKGRKEAKNKYTPVQLEESQKRSAYLNNLKQTLDTSKKYTYVHYPHTETDDLISLYCHNVQEENETVTILTTDKDLFQLIRQTGNKKVQVLFLIKRQLIKDESVGKTALEEKVWLGDHSDSIPGVCKNVGKVTYPDFRVFINKMQENNIDPTDNVQAKKVSESLGIKYTPSFSNFNKEQLSINKKLIDLSYVVELDAKQDNKKTNYLKEVANTAKFSPYALYNII